MSRSNWLVVVLLAALLPAACGNPDSGETPEGTPDLVVADVDDLRAEIRKEGIQLTVVNFWATWCVPCRAEFPDLIEVGKEFEDKGVQVLFVSTDFEDQRDAVLRFLEEQDVPWRSFLKEGDGYAFIQSFHEDWNGALPTTFFFDDEGQLVDYWEGISTYEEIKATIEANLNG